MKHTPVYEDEVIRALAPQEGKRYIDATVGEGRHLKKISDSGADVLGIDADPEQVRKAEVLFRDSPRVVLEVGNFADLETIARRNGYVPADGVFFDFGLSYLQIAGAGRGFTFKNRSEPLDMRLDPTKGSPASSIVNGYSAEDLGTMFMRNAEEINAHRVAHSIVRSRAGHPLQTVGDLTDCIDAAIGAVDTKTYARIFQALRIEVNHEFEAIAKGLECAWRILAPGGILAVITFHSREDRIVKRFMNGIKSQSARSTKFKNYRTAQSFEKSAMLRVIQKQ